MNGSNFKSLGISCCLELSDWPWYSGHKFEFPCELLLFAKSLCGEGGCRGFHNWRKKTQGILIKLLDPCWISLTIIVYKRPMFINPWNGFSQDLDICSRYAASLLFQDVLIFFSWSIVLYISNVGTWTIRFWQQIVDDQTRIDLISVFSFLMLFSTWS